MANAGKFIDRTPQICTAGLNTACGNTSGTLKDCMRGYPLIDQVDTLKHEVGIYSDKEKTPYVAQKLLSKRNCGIYTDIRHVMHPPVPTNYQVLIDDLKCSNYDTYWNEEIGKTRDPTPGLPKGMDPETVTFGRKTPSDGTVKELVNPPKSVFEVLYDSQDSHEMYKKTHNDYNIGERVCRNYLSPPYKTDKYFGSLSQYDARGIWVKCVCNWCVTEPVVTGSNIQADMFDRKRPQLGKCLTPHKNIERVPKDFRFGKKSTRPLYGVEELLKDANVPPCVFKRDFLQWMTHLNEMRNYIKRRTHMFSLDKFYNAILFHDKNNSGWIHISMLYKISTCQSINFDRRLMEPLLLTLGILVQDCVHYRSFINLINVNQPVPEMIRFKDVPDKNFYFITTNMAALADIHISDHRNDPAAGIPTLRHDLLRPIAPPFGCKADVESLGDETSAGSIINPSIYSNYGLSHLDFFRPREAPVIRRLFENLGYEFPDDTFEKMWKIGLERDKTGLVCVDTFKVMLEEALPKPEFRKEGENEKCYNAKKKECTKI